MNGEQTVKIKEEKKVSIKKLDKKEVFVESVRAISFGIFALLLGSRQMLFDTTPLSFAILAAASRQAPFIFLGIAASTISGGRFSLMALIGATITVLARLFSRFFLDKAPIKHSGSGIIYQFSVIFSEHKYLRVMSGAIGVFFLGIWRIISGGFRFYDLFAAIFYLVLTPLATFLFSWYFDISEQRTREKTVFSMPVSQEKMYLLSSALLVCALIYGLDTTSFAGISAQVFVAVIMSLYACKKGSLLGLVASLMFGFCVSPSLSPMCALCTLAYISVHKLSLFGASVASCIAGLIWGIYIGGFSTLSELFPALLSSNMIFCCAEKINIFADIESFFAPNEEKKDVFSPQILINEQKNYSQDEKLRAISDSFSSLSEIFYNLSSKLKRPTSLDLRNICEKSFENHCKVCENRDICLGAEYSSTLDVMKKITIQLHSFGVADAKKLPEAFKKRCSQSENLIESINKSCTIETKKAFQNEKTEIFALDYDAISKILNDALIENEEEFKVDAAMSKKLSKVISDQGFGEHNVTVFGKRKLKIIARGLDLSERASDVSKLRLALEEASRYALSEPTFELAFGSVNMQSEAKRAFSLESAFATAAKVGENICGDTVSIFENKNDYLYALISDGMGTGQNAAFVSEMCNVFLRNMLNAGNGMEITLKMLNSVIRAKGRNSVSECSATVDLLQFDLYSGALTLIKSGAAPTFVLRRGNVFKLGAPSFPIGILRSVDAKQIDISCEDGDIIVMVSDGAAKDGDNCDYLLDILRDPRLPLDSADSIADKLIKRARAEGDSAGDDVSIVVIKVTKELRNW